MFERINDGMLCRDFWVFATELSKPVRVSQIHFDGIVATDGNTYLYDELVGIYITTEWLHAAGFFRQDDGTFQMDGFPFTIVPHEYTVVLFGDQQIAGLRFVHELQLFYAGIKQRPLLIEHPPAD